MRGSATVASALLQVCQTWFAIPRLGIGAKDPDGGGFSTHCPHGEQQAVKFGNEERRSRACGRRDMGKAFVPGVFGIEHVQKALAAGDVNAVPLGIDENVVRIAANLRARGEATILYREYPQLGRTSEGREYLPRCGV